MILSFPRRGQTTPELFPNNLLLVRANIISRYSAIYIDPT